MRSLARMPTASVTASGSSRETSTKASICTRTRAGHQQNLRMAHLPRPSNSVSIARLQAQHLHGRDAPSGNSGDPVPAASGNGTWKRAARQVFGAARPAVCRSARDTLSARRAARPCASDAPGAQVSPPRRPGCSASRTRCLVRRHQASAAANQENCVSCASVRMKSRPTSAVPSSWPRRSPPRRARPGPGGWPTARAADRKPAPPPAPGRAPAPRAARRAGCVLPGAPAAATAPAAAAQAVSGRQPHSSMKRTTAASASSTPRRTRASPSADSLDRARHPGGEDLARVTLATSTMKRLKSTGAVVGAVGDGADHREGPAEIGAPGPAPRLHLHRQRVGQRGAQRFALGGGGDEAIAADHQAPVQQRAVDAEVGQCVSPMRSAACCRQCSAALASAAPRSGSVGKRERPVSGTSKRGNSGEASMSCCSSSRAPPPRRPRARRARGRRPRW